MGFITKPYRISYIAQNYKSGLTNIVGVVFKPDSSVVGPFPMTEMPSVFQGVYYFDFVTTTSDPEGEYFVIIVSPSETYRLPNGSLAVYRDTRRFSLYKGQPSPSVLAGINAVAGYVTAAQIEGSTMDEGEAIATIDNKSLHGKMNSDGEMVGLVRDEDVEGTT